MSDDLIVRPRDSGRIIELWLPLWDGYNAFYAALGCDRLLSPVRITAHDLGAVLRCVRAGHGAVSRMSGGQLLGLALHCFTDTYRDRACLLFAGSVHREVARPRAEKA